MDGTLIQPKPLDIEEVRRRYSFSSIMTSRVMLSLFPGTLLAPRKRVVAFSDEPDRRQMGEESSAKKAATQRRSSDVDKVMPSAAAVPTKRTRREKLAEDDFDFEQFLNAPTAKKPRQASSKQPAAKRLSQASRATSTKATKGSAEDASKPSKVREKPKITKSPSKTRAAKAQKPKQSVGKGKTEKEKTTPDEQELHGVMQSPPPRSKCSRHSDRGSVLYSLHQLLSRRFGKVDKATPRGTSGNNPELRWSVEELHGDDDEKIQEQSREMEQREAQIRMEQLRKNQQLKDKKEQQQRKIDQRKEQQQRVKQRRDEQHARARPGASRTSAKKQTSRKNSASRIGQKSPDSSRLNLDAWSTVNYPKQQLSYEDYRRMGMSPPWFADRKEDLRKRDKTEAARERRAAQGRRGGVKRHARRSKSVSAGVRKSMSGAKGGRVCRSRSCYGTKAGGRRLAGPKYAKKNAPKSAKSYRKVIEQRRAARNMASKLKGGRAGSSAASSSRGRPSSVARVPWARKRTPSVKSSTKSKNSKIRHHSLPRKAGKYGARRSAPRRLVGRQFSSYRTVLKKSLTAKKAAPKRASKGGGGRLSAKKAAARKYARRGPIGRRTVGSKGGGRGLRRSSYARKPTVRPGRRWNNKKPELRKRVLRATVPRANSHQPRSGASQNPQAANLPRPFINLCKALFRAAVSTARKDPALVQAATKGRGLSP